MIVLWMVFVYLEACVRVRTPNDNWSRLLGSNTLGYPIIMLGLGFKVFLFLILRILVTNKNLFLFFVF